MFIRKILIKNFRHLQDVALGPFSFPPRGSDIIALAGPNGGGKSSILELIGFALSNSWSLGWVAKTASENRRKWLNTPRAELIPFAIY